MVTFPSRLPANLLSGYSVSVVDTTVTTTMEDGSLRRRRKFRGTPSTVDVQWLLTQSELGVFTGWFEYEIDAGALEFTIDLKLYTGQANVSVLFVGEPHIEPHSNDLFLVSGALYINKTPILDKATYEFSKLIDLDDLERLSADFDTLLTKPLY